MDSSLDVRERTCRAARITWISVGVNTALTFGKLAAGLLGHSAAMIADALHSLSDFATDFAVLIGMRLAGRPQDDDHPYGHGKYETLAAVTVGIVLCGVGLTVMGDALRTLSGALFRSVFPLRPSSLALWVGLVSIVVKEALYQATARIAKATRNDALLANAWHHRSDALSSVGTVLGVGLAACLGGKWVLADAAAALLVGAILLKIALKIVRSALDCLMEHGMTVEENATILRRVSAIPGLSEPHHLRTRRVGAVAVIELHLRVSPEMTVRESHALATRVEQTLRDAFGPDTIVTIHIEPTKAP